MEKKRTLIALFCIIFVIASAVCIYQFTPAPQGEKSAEKLKIYTRNKPNAEITVAVVSDNGTEIVAYGHDGESIAVPDRSYEIGQITRTFTGAIAAEAYNEGYFSMDTPVSDVLTIARGAYSPSLFELLTHSSAYADYSPKVKKTNSANPYEGINGNDIVAEMNSFRLSFKPPYLYADSDFGTAVLGSAISKIYDVDFYSILTIFIQERLGLTHSFVALEKCTEDGWKWNNDDAYIASLGLTTNITDMVKYANIYLNDRYSFLRTASDPLYEENADSSIGYMWNISKKGWVLSQSGETGHYSASIVIDKNSRIAVIVLSNYRNDRYGNTSDIAHTILDEKNGERPV